MYYFTFFFVVFVAFKSQAAGRLSFVARLLSCTATERRLVKLFLPTESRGPFPLDCLSLDGLGVADDLESRSALRDCLLVLETRTPLPAAFPREHRLFPDVRGMALTPLEYFGVGKLGMDVEAEETIGSTDSFDKLISCLLHSTDVS